MGEARAQFGQGVVAGLPVVLGYFPIAVSFGVAASRAGFSAAEATAFSLIVYSGAAQFLAVALVAAGTPLLVAERTTQGTGGPVTLVRLAHAPGHRVGMTF